MSDNLTRVFVYGTLRKDFGNHRLLRGGNASYVADGITRAQFTMFSLGGFPGVAEGGTTPIYGELYDVGAETLQRLDRLEGHPNWYHREPIDVLRTDQNPTEWTIAEMYIYPDGDERFEVVKSGDWRKRAV